MAQSRYQLIEDPAGPWQDPVTGKHYRSTEDTGESLGGASGDGVAQVDVVALDGNDVVPGVLVGQVIAVASSGVTVQLGLQRMP